MGEGDSESSNGGWVKVKGLLIKTAVVVGGALFLRRLTKSTTRRDHARFVSHSLSGEKVFYFLSPPFLLMKNKCWVFFIIEVGLMGVSLIFVEFKRASF